MSKAYCKQPWLNKKKRGLIQVPDDAWLEQKRKEREKK